MGSYDINSQATRAYTEGGVRPTQQRGQANNLAQQHNVFASDQVDAGGDRIGVDHEFLHGRNPIGGFSGSGGTG